MFGRRRNAKAGDDGDELPRNDGDADLTDAAEPAPEPPGPYDADRAPADDIARVDFGALRVPVLPGLEIRVETDGNAPFAITLATATSALQLTAFAAPRTSGIWEEVRAEIAGQLADGAGGERTGEFGPELLARVPGPEPGTQMPARFVGVDGPRWFLRGVFTGAAAPDPAAEPVLDAALRAVIVVRGGEAMAVRDALPLRFPPGLAPPPPPQPPDGAPTLPALIERGPEITETR